MRRAGDNVGMTGLDPFEAFVRRYQDMVFAALDPDLSLANMRTLAGVAGDAAQSGHGAEVRVRLMA